MGIFQEVELSWNGEAVTIPADKVMGAIAVIEEHITFLELVAMSQAGTPKMTVIAQCYGAVLRYAGLNVSDEECYAGMFASGAAQAECIAAVQTLLVMCVPPDVLAKAEAAGDGKPGKSGAAKPGGSRPSKGSTKPRSGKGGSRATSSGKARRSKSGG
jgi:hypothetical protein